jgi:hypothetical protein
MFMFNYLTFSCHKIMSEYSTLKITVCSRKRSSAHFRDSVGGSSGFLPQANLSAPLHNGR